MATAKSTEKKTKESTKSAKPKTATKTKSLPIDSLHDALIDRKEITEAMNKIKKTTPSSKKRINITLTENQAELLKILAKGHKTSVGELIGNDLLITYLCYNKEDMTYCAQMTKDSGILEQVIVGN
jgi:hypothetical protein